MDNLMQNRFFRLMLVLAGAIFAIGFAFAVMGGDFWFLTISSAIISAAILALAAASVWAMSPKS